MQPGQQHIGPAPEVAHPETQEDLATSAGGTISYLMAPLQPAGSLGTKADIQLELDLIATSVRGFHVKQPDQVLREISAYTARLTEMVVLLHRVESQDRQYTRVRTMQVEKWLVDLDRQFKIASRLIEVQRQDIDMSR
jgi:hypothetical protein